MYLNWAHYYIPKVNCFCAYLVNPLFIYIIFNERKLSLGNYRYLLLYFALFNMTCSMCDVLVPTDVHDYRYAFSNFISGGPFEKRSPTNEVILVVRCSFISGTYAILHAHFAYRFLILFKSNFLQRHFLPYGIMTSILYLLFHLIYWMIACGFFLVIDDEGRRYIQDSMLEYDLDAFDLNMLCALYRDGSEEAITRALIGMGSITVLSVLSVIVYFILGYLIIQKLNSQALIMSERTKRLQRQLMNALIVQSAIPTLVSFTPCVVSWYQPAFGIDLGRWSYHTASIAVSAFPFFDPLAILFFVPTFRRRLAEMFGVSVKKESPPVVIKPSFSSLHRNTAETEL